jgi:hypothetical protein
MSSMWDAGRKVRGELDQDFPIRIRLKCRCGRGMGFLYGFQDRPARHYINGSVPRVIIYDEPTRFQHYSPQPPRAGVLGVFFNPATRNLEPVTAASGLPTGVRVSELVSSLPAKLTEGTLYYVLGSTTNPAKPSTTSRADRRKCRADWQVSFEVSWRPTAAPSQNRRRSASSSSRTIYNRSPGDSRRWASTARTSAADAPYRPNIARDRQPTSRISESSSPPLNFHMCANVCRNLCG